MAKRNATDYEPEQPTIDVSSANRRYSIGGNATRDRSPGQSASETENVADTDSPGESVFTPLRRVVRGAKARQKASKEAAKGAADMLVGVVQTLGIMRYGVDGKMTAQEHTMMSEGLTGSLVSLPLEVTQQVCALSAPVMAGFGFLIYATRLSTIEARRRQDREHVQAANAVYQAEQIVQQEPPITTENGTLPDLEDVRSRMEGV